METKELKIVLNDTTLLKWVKKFSADNLLEDNKLAKEKFNITAGKDSISILDSTATKLMVVNSDFEGDEIVRYDLKQLAQLVEIAGTKGEVIIPKKSEMKELLAKVGNDIIVVCPLPNEDKE